MNTVASSIKLGVLPSPQYTTWDALRDIAQKADRLGCDSLWCSDHLIAPYPWVIGPAFEAYTVLSAWAAVTERVKLGGMVTAFGFRNPALLVKMITTIDHISHGRTYLGIGAGWFEQEHRMFGFDFEAPGRRLSRFEEALGIIRSLLDGNPISGSSFYGHEDVQSLPSPVQSRLPILIGGRGDRMLGLVARYADAWNIAGPLDDVTQRLAVLYQKCEEIDRDPAEIELTFHGGPVFVRDTQDEAQAVRRRIFEVHGIPEMHIPLAGPPAYIAEQLVPFVEAGFRHMYFDLHSPYDEESLTRLLQEVRPMLTSVGIDSR